MGAAGLSKRIWRAGVVLGICLASIGTAAGAANTLLTPATPSAEACLPIDMPTKDLLFAAPKRVFAHYFSRFPLSFDNQDATVDYYSREYLDPNGEHDKWLAQGGYLRSRPLPVPVGQSSEYVVENLKKEIKLALSRGITGFTFDILNLDDIRPGSYLSNMLKAAAEVDRRFQIILMPDMASLGPDTDVVLRIIKTLYSEPGLLHFPDGRLVVSPFLSEAVSPAAWETMKSQLAQDGLKVAFVPTFLNEKYIAKYKTVGDGFGTWGTPLPTQGFAVEAGTAAVPAHAEQERSLWPESAAKVIVQRIIFTGKPKAV